MKIMLKETDNFFKDLDEIIDNNKITQENLLIILVISLIISFTGFFCLA